MGNALYPFLDLGADGNYDIAIILILVEVITKLNRNLLNTVRKVITLVLTGPFRQRTWTFVVGYFLFICLFIYLFIYFIFIYFCL